MKRNTAGQYIAAQMVSASDGSAFTGSVTVYITKDNGTQTIGSVGSGVCTHEGNGLHSYNPSQGETDAAHISFTFVGTGAVPVTVQLFTVEEIADALLERNIAGGSSTGRKVKEALAVLRNKWSISGTTLTVYDTDDVTPLFTATITASAGADPVSAVDPA